MIFETHAHYDDAKFDTDREMLLAELPQRGISPVINVGSSIARSDWIITGIRNRRYRRSRGIGLYGSLHWHNRQIFR